MQLYWADKRRFLSKLTWRRLWNMGLIYTSYLVAKWTRRPVQWGMPMTLSFEPTTACNLRCPECPSGLRSFTRDTGNMKVDFFRNTIDEVGASLTWLIFYFQGEPFIHPRFLDMVSYAHSKGIYTITSTNGHFLTKEIAVKTVASGLDRIIISVDGATQEVYEQYRREGSLSAVLEGARHLVEAKREAKSSTPHIIFQMLVVKPNEHQIDDVRKMARDIGVNEVKLKTAQVYDYAQGHDLIPTLDRYSRYTKGADGSWRVKNEMLHHCWKLWHASVITWDGTVVPCCFDKDAIHRLGTLKDASFRDIWHSPSYQTFRKQILAGRDQIDICTNCTEGCTVWV